MFGNLRLLDGSQRLSYYVSIVLLLSSDGLPPKRSLLSVQERESSPFATLKRKMIGGYRNT